MTYKKITLDITNKQLQNAANGKQITLSHNQLKGSGSSMHVHPSTYEKIQKAIRANKGVRVHICHGEIDHDLVQGGSLFSWLRDKAIPWVKKELYPAIKPAISSALDSAQVPLAQQAGPYADAVYIGRKAIKSLTGLGVPVKGSQEAKDKMAALRAKKKPKGGSFRLE